MMELTVSLRGEEPMNRARFALIAATTLFSMASHAATCESLQGQSTAALQITTATPVKAGAFAQPESLKLHPDLPAFCRVVATAKPSPDSNIGMEVWLPASDWNGKFLAVGSGGWGGAMRMTRWATH
jgi:feruloyl esterase